MNNIAEMPVQFPVTCHSHHVGQGSTFVALQGSKDNGINYIADALKNGAREIVVQEGAVIPETVLQDIRACEAMLTTVPNARETLALLSARANGYPARQLKIVGITGTKGKTTTTYITEHLLRSAGYKTALMSTVYNVILDTRYKAPLTTPQADYLHVFLRLCVEAGVQYVVMEVSAQALSMSRLLGITFSGIIFTNFEAEHAEFYANIEDYFRAKCGILEQRNAHAPVVLNGDDRRVRLLAERFSNFSTYGFDAQAQFQGAFQGNQREQVSLAVSWKDNEYSFSCPTLIGRYNAYNCLAAISLSLRLGLSPDMLVQALHSFGKVPGRLERFELPNGASAFIDYAHTPSSYEAVLSLLSGFTDNLVVVFGAGGDRDRTKRPKMGAIAARYAQLLVITADNPRSEDPAAIVDDIVAGIPLNDQNKIVRELDREKAIRVAYGHSKQGSIIAILGKGADEYQIVGSMTSRFSEAEIIQSL